MLNSENDFSFRRPSPHRGLCRSRDPDDYLRNVKRRVQPTSSQRRGSVVEIRREVVRR